MSQITRLLCYFFGFKFGSVLFFTLFPSLILRQLWFLTLTFIVLNFTSSIQRYNRIIYILHFKCFSWSVALSFNALHNVIHLLTFNPTVYIFNPTFTHFGHNSFIYWFAQLYILSCNQSYNFNPTSKHRNFKLWFSLLHILSIAQLDRYPIPFNISIHSLHCTKWETMKTMSSY